MLIVLHEGGGLFQIVTREVVSKLVNELRNDRYLILPNDDAFHLNGVDLRVPVVLSDVSNVDAFGRVSIKDALHEIFEVAGKTRRDRIVAGENFLVEFVCVGVFERQVAAGHRVEDNTTGPDIREQSLVLFAGDHFGGSVAGTATRRLKKTSRGVGI